MTIRCYLAHPVTEYGGARQANVIRLIQSSGWIVENPNHPEHEIAYKQQGMPYFTALVARCEALAFMRFRSGAISAGVAKEVVAALERGYPVFEATEAELLPVREMPSPVLTVDETRAVIAAWRAART